MTIDAVSEMTNNALYVIIKVSLPVLLVSLVVGLVISIFQTVTSIQEQTLTFVPKIVAIFLCLVVIGLSAPVPQVPGYLPQNRSAYLSLDLRFPEQDSTGNFVKEIHPVLPQHLRSESPSSL